LICYNLFMKFTDMNKKLIAASLSALLLTGCAPKNTTDVTRYETYYRAIEENTKFLSSSENYTVSAEMTQWDDGTYRYYVIFDEPKTAMYDIVIMAVEDGRPYEEAVKMMPSSGVFDAPSSMIPGQINSKSGYVKGVIVSGECEEDSIDLDFMVEWKDKGKKDTVREFLSFTLNMEGIVKEADSDENRTEGGE